MRKFFFLLIVTIHAAGGAIAPSSALAIGAPVLGYQSWKSGRIEEAKTALDKIQSSEKSAKAERREAAKPAKANGDDYVIPRLQNLQKSPRLDQKLQQAQLNLELARELTVNDYFVLYLSQFKGKDAFVDAAKKLTPEEAADLMLAYQKHLNTLDQADGPTGQVNSALPR